MAAGCYVSERQAGVGVEGGEDTDRSMEEELAGGYICSVSGGRGRGRGRDAREGEGRQANRIESSEGSWARTSCMVGVSVGERPPSHLNLIRFV